MIVAAPENASIPFEYTYEIYTYFFFFFFFFFFFLGLFYQIFSFPVDFLLFDKGDIFCDFPFPAFQAPSEKGSSLKGKNLLPT